MNDHSPLRCVIVGDDPIFVFLLSRYIKEVPKLHLLPYNFKTCYFVSCWTEDEKENIPLWHMYTGMRGVKISFTDTPFFLYKLQPKDLLEGLTLKSEINFPIPP